MACCRALRRDSGGVRQSPRASALDRAAGGRWADGDPGRPRGLQELVLVTKTGDKVTQENRAPVAFVPMLGEFGW